MGVALFFFLFLFLGIWQLNRLEWKNALLANIKHRAYAAPREVLSEDELLGLKPEDAEYLSVLMRGHFDVKHRVYVAASSKLGQGFWLMIPFQLVHGGFVWVNRGFVQVTSSSSENQSLLIEGPVQLFGLLRLSEPKGGLLRSNEPRDNRWYSRDVLQLNTAQHLGGKTSYFVDALIAPYPIAEERILSLSNLSTKPLGDETGESRLSRELIVHPVPGLTVLVFRNNHLAYAFTWFVLSLLTGGVWFWLFRHQAEPSS